MTKRSLLAEIAMYLVAGILSLAVLAFALAPHFPNLRLPFLFNSDSLMAYAWAKGMIEQGWVLYNPALGAPFGQFNQDFPTPDILHLLLIKLLTLVTHDYYLAPNLFALLTFPLTTLIGCYACRQLGMTRIAAVGIGLLYTFLPYHFFRAINHLMLAGYYTVPLGVLLIVWSIEERLPFLREPEQQAITPSRARVAVLAALTALSGVYYAAFTCMFLLLAGIRAALRRRQRRPLYNAAIVTGIIIVTLLLALAPTFLYHLTQGGNPQAVLRGRLDSESGGMKIIQLIAPVSGHRIQKLANMRALYDTRAQLVSENTASTLGAVGSIGFLLLMGYGLFAASRWLLMGELGMLTVIATLITTVGGFGTVAGILGFTMIRAYNRVSVFLSFFALLALGLLFERLRIRWATWRWGAVMLAVITVVVTGIGLLDEIPREVVLQAPEARQRAQIMGAFIAHVETTLPAQAMVYQLPYIAYPEGMEPKADMRSHYEHLRPYLASHTLRWSFGGLRGRPGDLWMRQTSQLPLPQMLTTLRERGFAGLYIDRLGYPDHAQSLERDATRLLGIPPLVSDDGELAFFPLTRR